MIEYQDLLKPISPESPTGIYLKSDRAVYRNLRNIFNAAQSSFRRLIETPDSSEDETLFEENQQNWQQLSDICWQTLQETSKDIEVYCWWLMSLSFQRDSIAKIAGGLETLVPFMETFWPDVHPRIPDEKLKSSEAQEQAKEIAELQLRPFIQLLGESDNSGLLYMPLQMLSLVGEIDHGAYLSATKGGKLAELKAQAQQAFSGVKNEVTATIKALGLALDSVEKLDAWIGKTCGELAISAVTCRFLRGNLNDCLEAIKYLVGNNYQVWPLDIAKQEQIPAEQPANPGLTEEKTENLANNSNQNPAEVTHLVSNVETVQQVMITSEQINNRDQAFQELRRLADYFNKAEPHSPVSFLLEKAIRWGYMSLPELMQELVAGNDKVLSQIAMVTGMDGEKTQLPENAAVSTVAAQPAPVAAAASAVQQQESNSAAVAATEVAKPAEKEESKVSTETAADSGFQW
ncbi:ImpA family type VI secretion system protein [Thalassomonas actiniarum]|uniref:Type VI secretion system ImpA family N-terminal domain-containing protein n=1 Tax=Thalassomonas actiniarum TaxID=485447 RepID=A0AAE9YRW5_9GAMM|nr:type VI secretion system ImpA family N-terminal domain-containing protein [Thalassomonas actiniarum]WDD99149.1 type VI secretion system ImpA family N-terminal domain-containing protein [Thalassomonas actiniarum]